MKMNNRIKTGITLITFLVIILLCLFLFLNNKSQFSEGKFGIYLLENDELIISDNDIISYNKTSQVIKLTEVGANKIQNLKVEMKGKPFVIKFDGREMYNGSFWISISSISSSGVVILTDGGFVNGNWVNLSFINSIVIQLGYPSNGFYVAEHPINNIEIFDYFKDIGKLIV